MSRFTSGFADKIDAMLKYRTIRGYKEKTHLNKLIKFDRFCAEKFPHSNELSCEIVHGWLDYETLSPTAFV